MGDGGVEEAELELVLDLLLGLFVVFVAVEAVPVLLDGLMLLQLSLLGFGGKVLALLPLPEIPEFETFAALVMLFAAARPGAAPAGDSTGREGNVATREGFKDLFESDGDGDGFIGDGGGGGMSAAAFEMEVAAPPLFFSNLEPIFSLPLPPPPFELLLFEELLPLPLNFPLKFEDGGEFSGASRDAHDDAAEVASVTSLLVMLLLLLLQLLLLLLDSEAARVEASSCYQEEAFSVAACA